MSWNPSAWFGADGWFAAPWFGDNSSGPVTVDMVATVSGSGSVSGNLTVPSSGRKRRGGVRLRAIAALAATRSQRLTARCSTSAVTAAATVQVKTQSLTLSYTQLAATVRAEATVTTNTSVVNLTTCEVVVTAAATVTASRSSVIISNYGVYVEAAVAPIVTIRKPLRLKQQQLEVRTRATVNPTEEALLLDMLLI